MQDAPKLQVNSLQDLGALGPVDETGLAFLVFTDSTTIHVAKTEH